MSPLTGPSLEDIADLLDPPLPRDESKPHVSTLVHRAAMLTGNGTRRTEEGFTQETLNTMALGRLWEYLVRPWVREEAVRRGYWFDAQVGVEEEGVIGSLDGMLYLPVGGEVVPQVVVEVKSRHASPGDPRDNWRWMAQCKAYCYMAGVTRVWIPALYLPRRGPHDAPFKLHEIEFEEHELVENWRMLMNMREG